MSKLFSMLVGLSMLGMVGVARAAEPVALSDAQLDTVTAGQVGNTVNEITNVTANQTVSGGSAELGITIRCTITI